MHDLLQNPSGGQAEVFVAVLKGEADTASPDQVIEIGSNHRVFHSGGVQTILKVGSRGGAPRHPQWYLNLVANPEVEVQVLADKFKARARPAEGEEKARLWQIMAAIWPAYDEYQKRTTRQIPLVVLERSTPA